MGRITLPRKIQKRTIIKLFMLSVFIFTGVYLYPVLKNSQENLSKSEDNWGEVLASTSNTQMSVVQVYYMGDAVRPDCDDAQPLLGYQCMKPVTQTTASDSIEIKEQKSVELFNQIQGTSSLQNYSRVYNFGTTDSSLINYTSGTVTSDYKETPMYWGNPTLEEVNGIPVLIYMGGFYEIDLNRGKQRLINISRFFSTRTANVGFTSGCNNYWFPSSVVRKGSTLLFGGGGLEDLVQDRCFKRNDTGSPDDNSWGTTIRGDGVCATYAKNLALPLNPGCRPTATESCWNKSYQCGLLKPEGVASPDSSQYYPYPVFTAARFSNRGNEATKPGQLLSRLKLTSTNVFQGEHSGGAGIRDAHTYCFGKTLTDCTSALAYVEYGDNLNARVSIGVDGSITNNKYGQVNTAKYVYYGIFVKDSSVNYKNFFKRFYKGPTASWQDQNGISAVFGGFDTPFFAYALPERVDFFQIYYSGTQSDTRFIKYRVVNGDINPAPNIVGFERVSPKDIASGVRADFVSDKYYFTVQNLNNNLLVKRFQPTGWNQDSVTAYSVVTLNNVKLDSKLRNVTFSLTSNNDLDIMVAPNFKDVHENNLIKTRMFRASKFNSPNGPYSLQELTGSNGGYVFPELKPGNNTPLTFRYYNDGGDDYAVFASKNYIYTSKLPSICTPNFNLVGGGLNLVNTSPLSLNKGILPNTTDADNSNYDLNFNFNSAINLSCPTGIVQIPAGTQMTLTLFDGITSAPLPTTLSANLLTDRRSINFTNVVSPNFKKYFYQVSFSYNGSIYKYPSSGVVQDRFYTLESFLNMYMFLDNTDQDPFPDAKMVITKTLVGAPNSPIQYNLTAPDGVSEFALNNDTFKTFFWDHNMKKIGTTLVDDTKYRICITNTSDSKITRIGFNDLTTTSTTSISNNFLSGTLSNGCLDLFYKSNVGTTYNVVPQGINVYTTISTTPAPDSYLNFRVNGNAMIKNSADVKMYNTSDAEKRYEGVYVSGSPKAAKSYTPSNTLLSSYYNIPYFSNLTKAINFSYTEDLVEYTLPTTEVTYLLLTDRKTSGSVNNYTKIDAFASIPTSFTPTIIYVAKNKQLVFDLTDLNIATPLENVYVVSTDKVNAKERIVFKVDCSDLDNYSLVCGPNAVVNIKGGIYGDFKITGSLNTQNENRTFVTITQNPEILIYLQKDLRSNKIFNVTRSKTIFKYFND